MATKNKKTNKLSKVAAEVDAATSALLIDEDQRNVDGQRSAATYCLGERQDRELLVTDDSVTIRSKSEAHKRVLFTNNRWAQFVALLPYIDEEAKQLNRQSRAVAYRQHIGDGYYVSVNEGFMCVDVRKFFLPYGLQPGEEKPTKEGIAVGRVGRATQHSTRYPSDVSITHECIGLLSPQSAGVYGVHVV